MGKGYSGAEQYRRVETSVDMDALDALGRLLAMPLLEKGLYDARGLGGAAFERVRSGVPRSRVSREASHAMELEFSKCPEREKSFAYANSSISTPLSDAASSPSGAKHFSALPVQCSASSQFSNEGRGRLCRFRTAKSALKKGEVNHGGERAQGVATNLGLGRQRRKIHGDAASDL